MQSKAKSTSQVTHHLNADGTITFTVLNARGEHKPGSLTFDPKVVSRSLRDRAEIHGWIQRISDKAAVSADTADKAGAKFQAMRACIEHYMQPGQESWNMGAVVIEITTANYMIQAIAEVRDITPEEALEFAKAMAEKKSVSLQALLKTLQDTPSKYRDAYDRIRPVNKLGDDLLSEMEGDEGNDEVAA